MKNQFLRCKNCLMASTRPEQVLNNNQVCNACENVEKKNTIDWKSRLNELEKIFENLRKNKTSNWDCVVPCSGGKDSTYQAFKMREFGLNPLIVIASTCDLTEIGKLNIDNLKRNFDVIEVTPNKSIRKKLNKISLELVGDIAWPEHVAIFTQPLQIAAKYDIKLLIYGENPQFQYGGPSRENSNLMNRAWLEEFGGFLGLRVSDLVDNYGFDEDSLAPYIYPDEKFINSKQIQKIFLGYYLDWDNEKNYLYAKDRGFVDYGKNIEGGAVSYEKLDNYQHGIHDYFKFLKYGFSRATDQISWKLRGKKINIDEGKKIILDNDGNYPHEYLGKKLENILSDIDMTIEEFDHIADKFTNKKIFQLDDNNNLKKDNKKKLILKDYGLNFNQ
jgi:N-acetyl sugar amidotransferase